MSSTNYFSTFIEVAEDCPATRGEIPALKDNKKSVANLQFEMLHEHPYKFTSDDVLFAAFATRKEIPEEELAEHVPCSSQKDSHVFALHLLPKDTVGEFTATKKAKLPCLVLNWKRIKNLLQMTQ